MIEKINWQFPFGKRENHFSKPTTEDQELAYYKTDAPQVLEAWKDYIAGCDALQKEGHEFAAMYEGATALFSSSIHSGRSFYGLKFNPKMDEVLWTKPDHKSGYSQFPRRSVPAGYKGEERKRLAAELEQVRSKYKDHAPKQRVEIEPFLVAMGLSGGALFFGRYKQFIGVDGFVYVETSATPSDAMTEILGSEFAAAERAHDEAGRI